MSPSAHEVADLRIPALTDGEHDVLLDMLTLWEHKRPRNVLRSAYYDGKNATAQLAGQLTPPSLRNLGLVLGWSAAAVDVLNRRCTLEGFKTDLDLPVDDVFSDNWLATEASEANISSLLHGVSYLVNTVGEEGEPPGLITGRDALSGAGIWDGRARRLRAFVSVNDTDDNNLPTNMVMYLPGLIITMAKSGLGWDVDRRPHGYGVPVEALTYRARLGRPFGYSRISNAVMSLHKQALRTMLRSEVTAELYQLPQRVLLGADEEAFMDPNGNLTPKWQAVMGSIWAIPADEDGNKPDVKQLPGASATPYLEQLRMQAQLFAGETLIPVGTLGLIGDSNPTSADAYMASYGDLIAEAENTADGWTPAWNRAMVRAVAMYEGVTDLPEEWTRGIAASWRSPAFLSRAAVADAGVKQLSAVPWLAETEVGLELLGLNDDQRRRALSEKRRAEGRIARRQLPPVAPVAPAAPEQDVTTDEEAPDASARS